MCSGFLDWLTKYEAVAIWLEGIALVAIFIWDRIDAASADGHATKQLAVFQDQVEATHRPFISYLSASRAPEDAVLDIANNYATTEIYCPAAQAQIKNYGSGPAINIRYALTPTNPEATVSRPVGYLAAVRSDVEFQTPIPRGLLQGYEWETFITYESLSGRKYQTKITSNNLVLTKISVTVVS
jgi:hypothetical protein